MKQVTEQRPRPSAAHPEQMRLPFPPKVFKSKPDPSKVFNFQHFKKLDDLDAMHAYANQTLGYRDKTGSARRMWIFRLGRKKLALKIARNDENAGYAGGGPIGQNKAEIQAAECVKGSSYFTHVVKYDPRYRWLIAELAEPFNVQTFERYTGISWQTFEQATREEIPGLESLLERLPENSHPYEWLEGLIRDSEQCNISPIDFWEANWGIIDGRPVVLDYGISLDPDN